MVVYPAEIQVDQGSQDHLWLLVVPGNPEDRLGRWNQESLDLRVVLCLLSLQLILEIQAFQENLVDLEKSNMYCYVVKSRVTENVTVILLFYVFMYKPGNPAPAGPGGP